MKVSVLIVDDEPRYLRLMEANLTSEGYQVYQALNGETAVEMVVSHQPDLVFLDIMMAGLDGYQVLERIREFSNVPVIMITARGSEFDRVKGLDLGADDYIVKPFSANEMLARARAVVRRVISSRGSFQQSVFQHNNLRIDFAKAEIFKDDHMVFLSATEYRLLLQFAHSVGKVLSSEELLSNVWGPEYKADKEILWVSISRLRQKLETDPRNPIHIVTRSGLGYTMPIEEEEPVIQ